jgi:uncharacterized membrane protein YesL
MQEIFHPDSKFIAILSKITDMIILNLLFIFSCIPIFTIGASVTALFTVTLKLAIEEEISPVRDYLSAFKTYFKKATFLWMILVVLGGVLGAEIFFLLLIDLRIKYFLLVVQGGLLLFYLSTFIMSFPLLSNFSSGAMKTLKQALTVPFYCFPESMALIAINIIPIFFTGVIFMDFPRVIMIWGFIGFSSVAYLASFVLNRIFQKMSIYESSQSNIET